MVAAGVFGIVGPAHLDERGAAEFPAPYQERFIEEAALLEVGDERGCRLVDLLAGPELFVELAVVIPRGVHRGDEADAALMGAGK
jgi:hypothetical protein